MFKITFDLIEFIDPNINSSLTKLALFDLDDTLTKYSRNSSADYLCTNEFVIKKIQNLYKNGYFIAITSNQNILNREKARIPDFKLKLTKFLEDLKVPVYFVGALTYSQYRKPALGMLAKVLTKIDLTREIANNLILLDDKSTNINKYSKIELKSKKISIDKIDLNLIFDDVFYVGDSVGRQNDYSDADVKFAHNAKIKFHLPEQFFTADLDNFTYKDLTNNYIKQYKLSNDTSDDIFEHGYFDDYDYILLYGEDYTGKNTFKQNYLMNYKNVYINTTNAAIIDKARRNKCIVLYFESENRELYRNMWTFMGNKAKCCKIKNIAEFLDKFDYVRKVPDKINTKNYTQLQLEIFKEL